MYASGEYKTYFERLVVKSQDIRKNVIEQRFFKQIDSFFVKPGKILDVGCGGGLICEPLARLGADVTGIDAVEESVEVAKRHANLVSLNIKYKKIIMLKGKTYLIFLEISDHMKT